DRLGCLALSLVPTNQPLETFPDEDVSITDTATLPLRMLISARAGEELIVRACHTGDLALASSASGWCRVFSLLWKWSGVDLLAEKVERLRRDLQFSFVFLPVLVIILSSPSLRALDPRQPLAQLYHSSWTEKQGINGTVTALAQTTDGYLWVGTTD